MASISRKAACSPLGTCSILPRQRVPLAVVSRQKRTTNVAAVVDELTDWLMDRSHGITLPLAWRDPEGVHRRAGSGYLGSAYLCSIPSKLIWPPVLGCAIPW